MNIVWQNGVEFFAVLVYSNIISDKDVMRMGNNTQYFKTVREPDLDVHDILAQVYSALTEKGYNPVNQIVGYVMSGDPTYITSHKNARSLIMKVERDEIIEGLLEHYIDTRLK